MGAGLLISEEGRPSLGRSAFWIAFLCGLILVAAIALDLLPVSDGHLVSELLDFFKWLIGLLPGYGGFKKTPWAKGVMYRSGKAYTEDWSEWPRRTNETDGGRHSL